MPTGYFSGYTPDTLIHLHNGTRKYIHELAPGDQLQSHDSTLRVVISNLIQFQYDGFISLLAPGLSTTRYTTYHDFTTGLNITPINSHCQTLYYHGTIYNFQTHNSSPETPNVVLMGSNPTSSRIGVYDINHNSQSDELINTILSNTTYANQHTIILHGLWSDPPGLVTQRHPKTASV